MSASSNARIGFFPPSSRPTLNIYFAAPSYTVFPVSTPPVNESARMSGWDTRPSPTTEPVPVSMLRTPGGNPASSRTSTNLAAQSGVKEEGLRTKEQPAMSAAPLYQAGFIYVVIQRVKLLLCPDDFSTHQKNPFGLTYASGTR